MTYLIFGDLHINQSSLKECNLILREIIELCNKYSVTNIISLGDNFDCLKPSSLELDLFAKFIRDLNRPITIIAADSHESTTQEESILNHYGILNHNIEIVKEIRDGNHLYCGHFSVKESSKNYGAKISIKDLKNYYLLIFLGHLHSFDPNIIHLGSCRFVNFDEAKDKYKLVALITNYNTSQEKVDFIPLKTPIPMKQFELYKNDVLDSLNTTSEPKSSNFEGEKPLNSNIRMTLSELIPTLDKLDPKTKVKVKILDFTSFREFLPLCRNYDTKFATFKYETDFEVISDSTEKSIRTEIVNFKESFRNYLNNQKIDLKIMEILQKEIE